MSSDTPAWLTGPCYQLPQAEKVRQLHERLSLLTLGHAKNCSAYRDWLLFRRGEAFVNDHDKWSLPSSDLPEPYGTAPPMSVGVFKHQRLVSVADEDVVVELNSSGTTGQTPARIFLDAQTARWQSLAMNRIVESFAGPGRFPLLLLDYPGILRQRAAYTARVAAILGFQRFGRPVLFAFQDESWTLNEQALQEFEAAVSQGVGMMVGMTAVVWLNFLPELRRRGLSLNLNQACLFHGGGWKKLQQQAVSRKEFHAGLTHQVRLERIHNYYGMVEQVGSIFMECEFGQLHAPTFADVVVRHPLTLLPQAVGAQGILQVVSALPESYPGHSLLTGDLGTIHGHDDCPCGRMGVKFSVAGRIEQLEPRGCSDAGG